MVAFLILVKGLKINFDYLKLAPSKIKIKMSTFFKKNKILAKHAIFRWVNHNFSQI